MNKNHTMLLKTHKLPHALLSEVNRLSLTSLLIATTTTYAFEKKSSDIDKLQKQQDDSVQFPALSVVEGLDTSVGAGSSVLKLKDIERTQANNIAELVDQLPGVSSSGSPRPGGQTLNIWGMVDVRLQTSTVEYELWHYW